MLDATKTTLRAANFFYELMLEAQKGKWGREPQAFQHFYSACIQAGRNVTWVMKNEAFNEYVRWEPGWRKQLTPEEQELEKFTNERRIDEAKRGGADMVAEPEEIALAELLAMGFELQMGRPASWMAGEHGSESSPLKGFRPALHFQTNDGKVKVVELCKKYLDYLGKKVGAFETALAATSAKQYPRGTATHEAGHAAVALSLGLEVKDIHVSGDDASGGAKIECTARLSFIEHLAVCEAGYAAEKIFGCRAHENAAAEDRKMVLKLLQGIPEDQAQVLRDQGFECAREHLEARKDMVRKLIDLLVERGYVDGREFRRLMLGKKSQASE